MLVLNYLVLSCIGVVLLALLLMVIVIFYVGITIIIEDIKKEKRYKISDIFYIIVSTLLKIASEIVVIIVGYVILCGLIRVISIMMEGGVIQW